MKFLLSLITFFLLLTGFGTSGSLIQNTCKQISDNDPNIKYDFCVHSLQEDPESRAATNVPGLLAASTKSALSFDINLKGLVSSLIKSKKYPAIDGALRDCQELFSDASDSLKEAIASIKAGNYREANFKLSAALDAPDTCETGIKEKKQPSPITKENNILTQKILIPLAISNIV